MPDYIDCVHPFSWPLQPSLRCILLSCVSLWELNGIYVQFGFIHVLSHLGACAGFGVSRWVLPFSVTFHKAGNRSDRSDVVSADITFM